MAKKELRVVLAGCGGMANGWVKNVLDEEYSLGIDRLETYLSGVQRSVGMPRTIGVSARYRF